MNIACFKCNRPCEGAENWYGLHKECFLNWFDLEDVDNFVDIAARSQSQAPAMQNINSSFFHGTFRKYSAKLGKVNYILKVEQPEYPELPATEYLCNQIYEYLGIPVPAFYLIRFPEQQPCFVTKNFMSHHHASTLDHMYHFVKPDMKYDCETLVKIIGEKTGRRIDQENFVYLTLADSLIGNNDRHGRNLGFIRSAKSIGFAPFYDNPSQLGVEDHSLLGADLQPRGYIYTRDSTGPTMKDYIDEWNRLGYENVVDSFRKNASSLDQFESRILRSYISEKRQNALLRLITKRIRELCSN